MCYNTWRGADRVFYPWCVAWWLVLITMGCSVNSAEANKIVASCNFQNVPACGFTQSPDNDFRWIVGKGPSPSWYSGPLADHTYNNSSGYYIYAPSSFNETQQGEVARFSFPVYQLREGRGSLRFFYHMWDAYEPDRLGTLTVYGCHGMPLWSRERKQQNAWLATGELDIYCQVPFQLIFEVIRGGFDSDIAVDDIRFVDLYQSPPTLTPPSTTPGLQPRTTAALWTRPVRTPTPPPRREDTPRQTVTKATTAATLSRIIPNSTPKKIGKTEPAVTPPVTWRAGSPSSPPVWTAFVLAGVVGGGFVLCFVLFFVMFFFCRRRRRSKPRSYNVDNMTYPATNIAPCGRCDAYYTALQTTRGVELHLYQELHQQPSSTKKVNENGSATNEAVHSADGGFYECIEEDQFSSSVITNDNSSEYTDADAANTATLPSTQPLSRPKNIRIEPLPFETGPESPSFVVGSLDDVTGGDDTPACAASDKSPVPFLEPKYFTLEPDSQCNCTTVGLILNNHERNIDLSEDEDVQCLSPGDIDVKHGCPPNDPISPDLSYCEPPMDDEDDDDDDDDDVDDDDDTASLTLTPTSDLLRGNSYGYIPPRSTILDRGGRRTEIITEI